MPAVSVVLELIQIRWNHKSLQLLSSDELDFIIASVCTGQVSVCFTFYCSLIFFHCVLLYDFNNKIRYKK